MSTAAMIALALLILGGVRAVRRETLPEHATPKELIAWLAPRASDSQKRTGIPASVKIAQFIQESGWTPSILAKTARNLFGIKAYSSWLGQVYSGSTWEEIAGVRVEIPGTGKLYQNRESALADNARPESIFRAYPTYGASITDHSRIYYNGKYESALQYRSNWREFLKRAGPVYATDSRYTQQVAKLIEQYRLYEYDVPASQWALDPSIVPEHHIATWRDAINPPPPSA